MNHKQIRDRLRDLQYVGNFPNGIEVLLVSLEHAFREINYDINELGLNPLTISQFRKVLSEGSILVFPNLEAWEKYKDPEKWLKNRRKRRNAP